MCVLDISANVGYHTFRLSKLAGPGGQVYAIEPTGWAYQKLVRNAALNPDLNNITFSKLGFSNANAGIVSVQFQSSYRLDGKQHSTTEDIELITLDTYTGRGHKFRFEECAEKDLVDRGMTIRLEFTPALITEIRYQRYNHLVPFVQRRMETLVLKAHGLTHAQIEEIVGVTGNTIREYCDLYEQGGIEQLKEINTHQPEGELVKQLVALESYFRDHPPASIKEAQNEIEEITSLKRSATQVREFLKKNLISVAEKQAGCPRKPIPISRKNIWSKKSTLV